MSRPGVCLVLRAITRSQRNVLVPGNQFDLGEAGCRKLLEAMTQLPPVPQALQLLDNQDASISRVGDWLQNRILAAFREEEEHSEGLQRDLKYQERQAASLQSILETYSSDPLEQKSRAAEKARKAAEQQLRETRGNCPQRWSDMSRSLPRKPRSSTRCGHKTPN